MTTINIVIFVFVMGVAAGLIASKRSRTVQHISTLGGWLLRRPSDSSDESDDGLK